MIGLGGLFRGRVRGDGEIVGSLYVSLRRDSIYLQSYSRNIDGLYVINGWVRVLPENAAETELGEAVLEGLKQTKDKVKGLHNEARVQFMVEFLEIVGVSSYGAYLKGTKAVSADIMPPDTSIDVVPLRNGGPSGPDRGFRSLDDLKVSLPGNASGPMVGDATARALTQAI